MHDRSLWPAAVLAAGVDEATGADALAQLITSAITTGGTNPTSDGLFLVVLGLVVAAVLLALRSPLLKPYR